MEVDLVRPVDLERLSDSSLSGESRVVISVGGPVAGLVVSL